MLTQLSIQNFGLIDQLTMEFRAGLNVLTGATGAGKSIIIDGLRMVLGERMSAGLIREGSPSCLVEAVFDLHASPLRKHPDIAECLSEDGEIIIQRQFFSDGRGKIKINGLSVTLAQLKALGAHLIDVHGPHDHQLLFTESHHLGILDQLTDFGPDLPAYTALYTDYTRIKHDLAALTQLARSRERDLDLLEHQIQELGALPLTDEAFEEVSREQVRLNNAERLTLHAAKALALLEDSGTGICELSQGLFTPLKSLHHIDPRTQPLLNLFEALQASGDELASGLRDYLEGLAFEPKQAEDINRRFDAYQDILRKYGPGLTDAAQTYAQAKERHEALINLEHNDAELRARLTQIEADLKTAAVHLSTARQKSSTRLKKTIEKELKELGMPHVRFEVQIRPADFHARGADQAVFHISPNAGEGLKPLAEIVSSGEAARVMLALKKALIKADPVPVLVFDEIDAQIGGRLGTVTGTKLKELSKARQVLLITHLPQIASFADLHLKVNKDVTDGRSVTTVLPLEGDALVRELAQMMSGDQHSDISLTHAEDMLAQARGG